ncbi:hypothetical protein GCM10027403_21520 [Arthrobacter tecti]
MTVPTAGDPHGTYDDGAAPAAVVVRSNGTSIRRGVASAVIAGIAAATLGTALHAHVWHVGGADIPVGAIGSVLLSASLAVFVGLWARNVMMAALTGVVAYALVGLMSATGAGSLIAAGILVAGDTPPVAVAGYVWVIGLAVGTVGAVAVSWRVLRLSDRRLTRR